MIIDMINGKRRCKYLYIIYLKNYLKSISQKLMVKTHCLCLCVHTQDVCFLSFGFDYVCFEQQENVPINKILIWASFIYWHINLFKLIIKLNGTHF